MIYLEIIKINKFYSSIEFISNIPLPDITHEEEILLNIDFKNIYIKMEKCKDKKWKNTDTLDNVLELNIKENIIKKDILYSNTKTLELIKMSGFTNIDPESFTKNKTESENTELLQKCNKCLKYDLLVNNLFEINKKNR